MAKKIDKDAIQSKDLVISINNSRLNFSKAFVLQANLVNKYVDLYIDHKNQRIAFEILSTKLTESYKVIGNSSDGYYTASTKIFELDWVLTAQSSELNKFVAFQVEDKWIISLSGKKIKKEEKVVWEKISNGSKKSDNAEVNFNVTQKRKWLSFTTKFVLRAQIELKNNVQIFSDSTNQRLRFQFHDQEVKGSYKVTNNNSSFETSSTELFKIQWILNAIEKSGKKFSVSQDSKSWITSLNANKSQKLKAFDWVQIQSNDRKSKFPSLRITKNGFRFSTPFANEAQIDIKRFVKVSFNDELRKIEFEFFKNQVKDSIQIQGTREGQYYISGKTLFEKEWVKAILSSGENQFKIEGNSKIWFASIAPAFENKVKRENSDQISSKVAGIYKYLNKGEIVYIGKGNVRQRLKEQKRIDWKFDTIEFSEVPKDKQHFWEDFWIKSFENKNGKLPKENKIHGFDK